MGNVSGILEDANSKYYWKIELDDDHLAYNQALLHLDVLMRETLTAKQIRLLEDPKFRGTPHLVYPRLWLNKEEQLISRKVSRL